MREVLSNVFIGDIHDLTNEEQMQANNIKFVVSVCNVDNIRLPSCVTNHLHHYVEDDENGDLLNKFPESNAFIKRALEEACCAVMIHCVQAVSRSATVIMAYIMWSQNLHCPQAFRILKKQHKLAYPSESFRDQLKLYDSMGCTLDDDNPEYRMYRLMHAIEESGSNIEEIPLGSTPHGETWRDADIKISCRKCRFKLCTERNIIDHEEGTGQLAFRWHKRARQFDSTVQNRCTSLFVEPMQWMHDAIADGTNQGKLCCSKCKSRFGNFNWSGFQCSCGAWVVPAFQFIKSKVDIVQKKVPQTAIDSDGPHDESTALNDFTTWDDILDEC